MTTENTKGIRESANVVHIEGLVSDVRIEEIKPNDGKDFIGGEIDIKVNDNVHTIRVFSFKVNKEGKESGLYKGIETVKNEYKSIEKHGAENADKVRVDSGKLGSNDYVGQDGILKSYPQQSANFINRIQPSDVFEQKAEFTLEMFISNVSEEKKNDVETGRAIVKGYSVGYGSRVFPFEFVVGEDIAQEVIDTYEKGQTATFYGDIVNRTVVKKTEVKVGVGKPKEDIKRTTTREYIVTSVSEARDEEDAKAYEAKEIKKGQAEREKFLEELKEKHEKKNKNKSSAAKNSNKPVDISDDDLPF